jgi:hypothetical protein
MNELKVVRNRRKINGLTTTCLVGFDGPNDSVAEIIGKFSTASEVVLDRLSLNFTYNIDQSISIPKLYKNERISNIERQI